MGSVAIVGAGPGDPELITVRGLNRLRACQVVIYDRLVSPLLLDAAPAWAERIFVGKQPGGPAHQQRDIEAILVREARAGRRVVRLKGGDPFVFGRGGEEALALIAAGVPVEIVPGVTSATAVPALAGIPVTQRGLASAVTIVTAHEDPTKDAETVDWEWLAAGSGTLVILMGLSRLPAVCRRLIAAGRAASTPAAVIASGTLPEQQVVVAELATLGAASAEANLQSPALIVVGDVVSLQARLASAGSGSQFAELLGVS